MSTVCKLCIACSFCPSTELLLLYGLLVHRFTVVLDSSLVLLCERLLHFAISTYSLKLHAALRLPDQPNSLSTINGQTVFSEQLVHEPYRHVRAIELVNAP